MICHHYELDVTFKDKEVLKGRIEKANLPVWKKPDVVVIDKNHESFVPKTKVSSKVNDNKPNSKKPRPNQRLMITSQITRNQRPTKKEFSASRSYFPN